MKRKLRFPNWFLVNTTYPILGPSCSSSTNSSLSALPIPRNTSQEFRRMAHQQRSGSQQSLGSMSGTQGSQVIHRTHYQQPPQHQQAQIVQQQQQQFGAGSGATSGSGTSSAASGAGPSVNGNGSAPGSNGSKYILGGDR